MVSRGSEDAIADIIMGVLAEGRHAARDPVRRPIDELAERNARRAEQPPRLGGVDEQGVGRFDADKVRLLAQTFAERFCEPADAHRLRPADIERARRHGAVAERPQHHAIGIALPDHVDMAGRKIDRRAGEHTRGHVVEDAVAHIDCVVEADDAARRSALARKILEHGLARDAGIGVSARRRYRRRCLGCAAVVDIDIRVHAAGRIGDDARADEAFGNEGRHQRVHGPGQFLLPGGAELASRHEHHIGRLWQRLDLPALEQIGLDALDAPAGEFFAHAFLAEAGNTDNALVWRGAFGETGERRPDFSGNAEHDDVAGNLLQCRDQCGRWRGHHLLEVRYVAEVIRERFGGLAHAVSSNGRCPQQPSGSAFAPARRQRWQNMPADVQSAASEEPELAMKVFMFHLMPYAYLDMSFSDKYRSAWVALPNTYFDPKKGHELYNRYLDELELAAELGFDGISVNEHHQNAYGLMPSPIVMAAALSRRVTQAKIAILGSAFCLRQHPLNIAEEHAMIDCITGGRIITGMVRGIGAEYYSTGNNPAISHARFQEAHDLVVQAWTRAGPFPFEGKFYHFEYVNVWPRPYQQPHPPIWTPSTGSSETIEWSAHPSRKYVYLQTYSPIASVARFLNYYREAAQRLYGYTASSEQIGWCAPVYVSDSDEKARAEAAPHIEALFNKLLRQPFQMIFPPGYLSAKSLKNMLSHKRSVTGQEHTIDTLIEQGIILCGSPDSVRKQLVDSHHLLGFQNFLAMLQFATLPRDLTDRNIRLFAREVLPALQTLTDREYAGLQ